MSPTYVELSLISSSSFTSVFFTRLYLDGESGGGERTEGRGLLKVQRPANHCVMICQLEHMLVL